MEQNDEIAMQLWEYIDGDCNNADKQRIAQLIAEDIQWKQLYTDLLSLHQAIPASIELEQPSMRFSKNIMEAVAQTQIAPATTKYINKNIIKGIAAFFIIGITAMLGYAIANTDWSTGATLNLPKADLSRFFSPTFYYAAAIVNVILALALLDVYIRRKHTQNIGPKN